MSEEEILARLDHIQTEWQDRIKLDVAELFAITFRLRKAADRLEDTALHESINALHEAVCHTANTAAIKTLLNGYLKILQRDHECNGWRYKVRMFWKRLTGR